MALARCEWARLAELDRCHAEVQRTTYSGYLCAWKPLYPAGEACPCVDRLTLLAPGYQRTVGNDVARDARGYGDNNKQIRRELVIQSGWQSTKQLQRNLIPGSYSVKRVLREIHVHRIHSLFS